jgi:murein DD-endopeptidase MepM/ murein hydrolase activator NlpD
MKFLFISICTLFLVIEGFCQTPSFVSPVNIPLVLNGNFGEIRSNHFHAGIDIKTNGATGLPVFSISDGVVSRISVSATGYGKTLYIDHPSGYTSVYAHLDRFIPEIEKWVKETAVPASALRSKP